MAKIKMQTEFVLNHLNASGGSGSSAVSCVADLRTIFDEIGSTAEGLNGVWDDEAQREFMDRFTIMTSGFKVYLDEVSFLLARIGAGVERIKDWDFNLAAGLNDPHLNA
jgi:hypothetical protein